MPCPTSATCASRIVWAVRGSDDDDAVVWIRGGGAGRAVCLIAGGATVAVGGAGATVSGWVDPAVAGLPPNPAKLSEQTNTEQRLEERREGAKQGVPFGFSWLDSRPQIHARRIVSNGGKSKGRKRLARHRASCSRASILRGKAGYLVLSPVKPIISGRCKAEQMNRKS